MSTTSGTDSFELDSDSTFDVAPAVRGQQTVVEDPIRYAPPQPAQPRRPVVEVMRDANRTGARIVEFVEDVAASCSIGPETHLDGNLRVVRGKSVIIGGTVNGNVECEGIVMLLPGGRIHGNVHAGHLWVEGEITPLDGKALEVEVGILHLGSRGLLKAHCTYDHVSMADGNRGIQGSMTLRQHDGPEA